MPARRLPIPRGDEFGDGNPGVDETLTNETVTFQAFISSQVDIGGTNYNVLYGGIQWGYSFSTIDLVPEPSILALGGGFLGAALLWRLRRKPKYR